MAWESVGWMGAVEAHFGDALTSRLSQQSNYQTESNVDKAFPSLHIKRLLRSPLSFLYPSHPPAVSEHTDTLLPATC